MLGVLRIALGPVLLWQGARVRRDIIRLPEPEGERTGSAGTGAPLAVTWVDDNSWEVTLPVAPGANTYTIEAIGFDGSVIGSDSFAITGTGELLPADSGNLAVGELHYHPSDPNAEEVGAGYIDESYFEWLELVNLSDEATVDLSGIALVNGIDFVVPAGVRLAAGERLVIAADPAAFTMRYGVLEEGTLLPFGYLANDGSNKFSNAGDEITLLSAAGIPITHFIYGDDRPWPVSADGDGYSLTAMRPGLRWPQCWQIDQKPGSRRCSTPSRR